MRILGFVLWMFPVSMMVLDAGVVCGQDYPKKPIRIIASPPGGATDFMARITAQGLSGRLGQPVVVDNRPSALTGEIAAKAPPDGYTLLSTATNFWTLPLVRKTSYDPVRDFSPITLVATRGGIIQRHGWRQSGGYCLQIFWSGYYQSARRRSADNICS